MNSLWPAASRFSCANARSLSKSCHNVDSLVARLGQQSIRPYSISSLPFRRRTPRAYEGNLLGRVSPTTNPPWSLGLGPARTYASQRIITKWQDLPESYSDKVGIPFRNRPITQQEALKIFGKGIDANSANRLLRALHGRRVAGTLTDPEAISALGVWERMAQAKGLEWLRKNVPVDEVLNAGLRAEKELAEMEEDILADSTRIGLYKPNNQAKTIKVKSQGSQSVYGKGVLEQMKEERKKIREAEEAAEKARKKQADEIQQNTGTLEPVTARRKVELRRAGEHPWLKYYTEKSKVLPNTPPDMTMFQRLWPSGLLTLGVLLLCVVVPLVYTAPKNSNRLFPDTPPAAATVLGIIAFNFLIFCAWRSPPFWKMLNTYFMTVPGFPIPMSLLGNIFSHQQLSHFAINMSVLYLVGSRLHDEVGRANFLAIYFGAGMLGSFASLTSFVVRSSFVSSTLGASGAIAGVIAAYLWLNKNEAVTLFGLTGGEDSWLRMPSWLPLAIMIGLDVFAVTKWNKKPVEFDHWAHLGGYFSGMAAAEIIKARTNRRRKLEEVSKGFGS